LSAGAAIQARRRIDTPVGALWAAASAAGLRELRWSAPPGSTDSCCDAAAAAHIDALEAQLAGYFSGELRAFDVRLDPVGTPFQLDVWRALQGVPYGRTVTYGQQAARIGRPSAVRAVAAANGRNPLNIVVPCHRVVGADGTLTGYAGGLEAKRWLLDLERGAGELF
jgi:methylated-DNA-[protein]-cysteine S-methyltransferase